MNVMNAYASVTLDAVRRAAARPARGLPAQLHMTPPYRDRITPAQITNPNYGAVLVLLYPKDGELHFVLMRRTEHHLDRHRGQISLPGGRRELSDPDNIATALREAREELGITLDGVEVLCALSELYIPPSNFYIYPVIACIPARPEFKPDPGEVAELIEVPLSMLMDPQTRVVEEWLMPGAGGARDSVMMPYYDVRGHKVWGATAMVLAEFAAMVMDEMHVAPGITLEALPPAALDARMHEVLTVYRAAFAAPPYSEGAAELAYFAQTLPRHAERAGFRFVAASEATTHQVVGFAYGYTGQPSQWWYDTVAAAMGEPLARVWLADCFEFVEMAVLPVMQGYGIGGRLHDAVLRGLPQCTAVLSTYRGDTNAMMLYRKRGWEALLEDFVYPSDSPTEDKPFVIMGMRLPRD